MTEFGSGNGSLSLAQTRFSSSPLFIATGTFSIVSHDRLPSKMRIAEILSDLTSLRVCVRSYPLSHTPSILTKLAQDHQSALALVSCHQTLSSGQSASAKPILERSQKPAARTANTISENDRPKPIKKSSHIAGADGDPDLQRAMDLVDLHYGVKMLHVDRVDQELEQARREVEDVITIMSGQQESRKRRG